MSCRDEAWRHSRDYRLAHAASKVVRESKETQEIGNGLALYFWNNYMVDNIIYLAAILGSWSLILIIMGLLSDYLSMRSEK